MQIDISHLFALSLNVLFDLKIGPYQVLPLRDRVDREAMAMKGHSTFPKAPDLKPDYLVLYRGHSL